jgi:hypothetical protein
MKSVVFWDETLCGSCKNRRFGGTYRTIIRVKRISELGTTLAVTSSPILFTLMILATVPPKRRFLQESHGVTTQKTAFVNFTYIFERIERTGVLQSESERPHKHTHTHTHHLISLEGRPPNAHYLTVTCILSDSSVLVACVTLLASVHVTAGAERKKDLRAMCPNRASPRIIIETK